MLSLSGLYLPIGRQSFHDETPVHRFGSGVEALRYMHKHQEEYSARGFSIVFCKSIGVDHSNADSPAISTATSVGAEASFIDDIWLEQIGTTTVEGNIPHLWLLKCRTKQGIDSS